MYVFIRWREGDKNKTSITNIWRSELLHWLRSTVRFQIRGNITALALAVRFGGVRPWSLLAVRAGCHARATLPARQTAQRLHNRVPLMCQLMLAVFPAL